jgi:hypothetical protein
METPPSFLKFADFERTVPFLVLWWTGNPFLWQRNWRSDNAYERLSVPLSNKCIIVLSHAHLWLLTNISIARRGVGGGSPWPGPNPAWGLFHKDQRAAGRHAKCNNGQFIDYYILRACPLPADLCEIGPWALSPLPRSRSDRTCIVDRIALGCEVPLWLWLKPQKIFQIFVFRGPPKNGTYPYHGSSKIYQECQTAIKKWDFFQKSVKYSVCNVPQTLNKVFINLKTLRCNFQLLGKLTSPDNKEVSWHFDILSHCRSFP